MESRTHTLELPQKHRAHLIRSTRKIGALLGETPLVDEAYSHSFSRGHTPSSSVSSVSSTESASKRSGRIFAPAATRSSSFAADDARPQSPAYFDVKPSTRLNPNPHARPTLYLRLAAPARPTSAVSLVSPTSPGFSPRTPTFAPDVARRRKLAKLARTLGQNVPPELVFSAADAKARAKYIPSPVVVPALAPAPPSPALDSATREAFESAAAHRHSALLSPRAASATARSSESDSEGSDGYEWVDAAPASYPPSPRTPHYVRASPTWSKDPADRAHMSLAPDARFLSRHMNLELPRAPSRAGRGSEDEGYEFNAENKTYRREQGWSGEWSGAQGMGDVVARLRGLKGK